MADLILLTSLAAIRGSADDNTRAWPELVMSKHSAKAVVLPDTAGENNNIGLVDDSEEPLIVKVGMSDSTEAGWSTPRLYSEQGIGQWDTYLATTLAEASTGHSGCDRTNWLGADSATPMQVT